MKRPPLNHQRPFLEWAEPRDAVGVFFEMRLGKCYVTLAWATAKLKPHELALVVAPTSTIPGWLEQLEMEEIPATWLVGGSAEKRKAFELGLARGHRWYLVNPEGLRAAPDLCDYKWSAVILDETPSFLSNPQSQVTKTIRKRLNHARLRAILSGEPAPEHDLQYFEQMAWLNGGKFCGFDNYWTFRARCWHPAGFDWFPNRGVKDMMAAEIAKAAFQLSAKDAGIPDLRVYETRHVELPGTLRRLYRKIKEEFALGDLMTRWMPVAQTWMCQVAGGVLPDNFREGLGTTFVPHKFVELENLLTTELKGKPTLVTFRYNREIRVAAERLRKKGFKIGCFTGWTDPRERQRIVSDFARGRLDHVLSQGRAGRFGLDFHRASAMIFFSNWWDWGTRAQLEARIRHPLRTEPALYLDIVTRGTVDEAASKALRGRKLNSRAMLEAIRGYHERMHA